jgi:peroxiredoxin
MAAISMTLEDELREQRERSFERRSPDERAARADAIAAVTDAEIAKNALDVGDPVPDFVLLDAQGLEYSIRERLQSGPVVISFYRGGWCPYCNLELRALQARLPELSALGATLVAISPELPDQSLTTKEKNALSFAVLSDVGNRVARRFRLTHEIPPEVVAYQLRNGNDVARFNGAEIAEVPLPATYVIDRSGRIRYVFVNPDYTHRADPNEIIRAVAGLT